MSGKINSDAEEVRIQSVYDFLPVAGGSHEPMQEENGWIPFVSYGIEMQPRSHSNPLLRRLLNLSFQPTMQAHVLVAVGDHFDEQRASPSLHEKLLQTADR